MANFMAVVVTVIYGLFLFAIGMDIGFTAGLAGLRPV